MAWLARSLLVVAALALTGCSEGQVRTENVPFEGEAFVAKTPSFTLPTGPYAIASDSLGDTLSIIDLTTRSLVAKVRTGATPIDIDGPHHLAIDRSRGAVYVALSYPPPNPLDLGPHAAHGSSSTPGKVLRLDLATLRSTGEAPADTSPGDIVMSDDGTLVVVTHFDLLKATNADNVKKGVEAQRASLIAYDAPQVFDGKALPRKMSLCVAPHGVALSKPDGRFAHVACYGEDEMVSVDLRAPDPSQTIVRTKVGPSPTQQPGSQPTYGPYATGLSPDGSVVAVGCSDSRELRLYDTEKHAMREGVWAGSGSVYFAAFSADGATMLVPTQQPDALVKVALDGGELRTVAQRPFGKDECRAPHEVQMWGDRALLVCEGDHVGNGHVLFVDPATLEIEARVEVGVYPDRVQVVLP